MIDAGVVQAPSTNVHNEKKSISNVRKARNESFIGGKTL
jgi:hypothetical protein